MVLPLAAAERYWDMVCRERVLMRLCVGDDWAEDHHDVEVMDEVGKVLVKKPSLSRSGEAGCDVEILS
jgi:hypothetical protein